MGNAQNKIIFKNVDELLSAGEDVNAILKLVPLHAITPGDSQPRKYFDPEELKSLAASIRKHGILEPLVVRPSAGFPNQYEIIGGERRYRAAKLIDLKEVPVRIVESTDEEAKELALVENLQREDLNPVEETEGVLKLLEAKLKKNREKVVSLLHNCQNRNKGKSTRNVAGKNEEEIITEVFHVLGKYSMDSFLRHRLPLLSLPEDILSTLRTGALAYTKATAISKVPDETARKALLEECIEKKLSLSTIRNRIAQLKSQEKQSEVLTTRDLCNKLRDLVSTESNKDVKSILEEAIQKIETLRVETL